MRDIHFRAQTIPKENIPKMWVYGYVEEFMVAIGKRHAVIHQQSDWNLNMSFGVDPETIGQFTGLKDKDGVQIYEGDFVRKWNRTKPKNDFSDGKASLVHWTPTNCGFNLRNPNPKIPLLTYEVVGNMHENPNLLKQSNP